MMITQALVNSDLTAAAKNPNKAYTGPIIYDYVDSQAMVLANYEDMTWNLPDHLFNRNIKKCCRSIRFSDHRFVNIHKYTVMHWLCTGAVGKTVSVIKVSKGLNLFFRWLSQSHLEFKIKKKRCLRSLKT